MPILQSSSHGHVAVFDLPQTCDTVSSVAVIRRQMRLEKKNRESEWYCSLLQHTAVAVTEASQFAAYSKPLSQSFFISKHRPGAAYYLNCSSDSSLARRRMPWFLSRDITSLRDSPWSFMSSHLLQFSVLYTRPEENPTNSSICNVYFKTFTLQNIINQNYGLLESISHTLVDRILSCRWKQQVPPKRRYRSDDIETPNVQGSLSVSPDCVSRI